MVSDAAAPFPGTLRFGYGYVDENFNFVVDPGERKGDFEVGAATTAIFFENYRE